MNIRPTICSDCPFAERNLKLSRNRNALISLLMRTENINHKTNFWTCHKEQDLIEDVKPETVGCKGAYLLFNKLKGECHG